MKVFKFIKNLLGNSKSEKTKSAVKQTIVNQPQDYNQSQYGGSFNTILNFNKQIARCIEFNSVPQYAIDWLADSIRRGAEIEFSAVYDSIEMQLPYLCETESETWLFTKQVNPLMGSTEGIYSAIVQYKYGSMANQNKLNLWINRLIYMADNGDNMAKGLICWRCGYILSDGNYDGVLPKEMWDKLRQKYESPLLDSYNKGDPYAKLAIAEYKRDVSEADKESLYLSAIESGLTDACYYYIKFLNLKRFVANGMTDHIPTYGTEEWQIYMKDELSLYKKGAELDNGVMAGYCQFRLADMYSSGDGGVLKDQAMAQYWYKKSFEKGYAQAKSFIQS